MAEVFTPKETESTRRLHQTDEERKKFLKEFRDDKAWKQKLKEERFAKMAEEKRNNRNAGKGEGINIKVGENE